MTFIIQAANRLPNLLLGVNEGSGEADFGNSLVDRPIFYKKAVLNALPKFDYFCSVSSSFTNSNLIGGGISIF